MIKRTDRLVNIIPWIAILPYLLLAFFARPAADDLTPHFYVIRYGWLEECRLSYLQISGRFFSLSLFLLITSSRYVFSHYFLIPLSLFSIFIYASYRAFTSISNYYPQLELPRNHLLAYAVLTLLIYLAVIPDTASSFYWMAAAVTYQVPIILIIFFIRYYIVFLNTGKLSCWITSTGLVFLIFGSNEVFIFLFFPLLTVFSVFLFVNKHRYRGYTLSLLLIGLVSACLVIFAPSGNTRATGLNASPGLLYVFSASVVQVLGNWFAALNTPLFWVVFLIVILKASGIKIGSKYFKYPFYLAALILIFSLLACIIVFKFKDNGLPGRAMNVFSFFFLISMVLFATGIGFTLKGKLHDTPVLTRLLTIVSLLTVFTSINYITAAKDLLSGFAFSSVYDKRVSLVEEAVRKGRQSVSLQEYGYYWNDFIDKSIPPAFKKPFRKLVNPYPVSVFICDDLAEKDWDNGFAEYYNIDTIFVHNKIVLRHSIVKGFKRK